MKHLYLNLKRFDVPVEYGGVNRIAPLKDWGGYIVSHTQEGAEEVRPQPGGVRPVLPRGPHPGRCGRSV